VGGGIGEEGGRVDWWSEDGVILIERSINVKSEA
jgi:hypothetical protein